MLSALSSRCKPGAFHIFQAIYPQIRPDTRHSGQKIHRHAWLAYKSIQLLNSFKYMKHFLQNCEMLVIILPTTDYEDRMYALRLTEDMRRLLQMMRLKTISADRVCRWWPIRCKHCPMRSRASQAKDVKYEDVKEWHSEICNYAHCLFCEPGPVIIMTTR